MAKRKLISDQTSFPDLTIIGISCQMKDYRTAFFLNRDLKLNLARLDDIPVFSEKDGVLLEYPLYACYEPERRLHYYLMGNNNPVNKMIPAYKQADYILMLKGLSDADRISALASGIRKISGVQMAFTLDNSQVKNLEGIMADLELHLVRQSVKGG